MNYKILAKLLLVREKFDRNIWKSEVLITNTGAGFIKVDISNLVEIIWRKLKATVPSFDSFSSQWVRFVFFSLRHNEVKQFKWYFVSLATMSPSDKVAIRLRSFRFCAAFLARLCGSSIWHLWKFFGLFFCHR